MKTKMKIRMWFFISALSMGMMSTAHASAAEFTDVGEEVVFDAGEAETEFDFQESVETESEEMFAAETADRIVQDGITYEYLSKTDSYRVVKGVNREEVILPEKINGKLITEVGKGAFKGCDKLKMFFMNYIRTGITIRENAFEDCINLRKVCISRGSDIKSGAFKNCPRLSEFYGMDWIYELDGMKSTLAKDAFDKDTKVMIITCGGVDSEIGQLLNSLGIYQVDVEAGIQCYEEKKGLTYVRGISDVGKWEAYLADYDDRSKEVIVTDDSDSVIIGRKAFYGCEKVHDVLLTKEVTAIKTKAFYGCKNLQKITIPASVKSIASDAFAKSPNVVIYAPKGSYALSYAKKKGIAYKVFNPEKIETPVLKYTRDCNRITLKWGHIPYADGYQIFKYNESQGKYIKYATTKHGNIHQDEVNVQPGETARFKVRAFSDAEIYSERYSASSPRVEIKAAPAPAKVWSVSDNAKNKLTLTLKAKGSHGYVLYRSEKEAYKGYRKIKTISGGSTVKYTDTDVKSGKTYYYRVRAFRLDGKERIYGELGFPFKVTCG